VGGGKAVKEPGRKVLDGRNPTPKFRFDGKL
jgi:hypothetical protein